MGIETVIGAIGVAASVAGTVAGVAGGMQQAKAAQRAERLRERQMNLDAARQKREIARQAMMARATAVSTATDQGAQFGSGLAGGQAQISNSANQGILAVNQNKEIGAGIFQANRDYAKGGMLASFGAGLQGFGGLLTQNQELFGRVGAYARGS